MDKFKDSGLVDTYFEKSYGFAVFPKVGKFAFLVGLGGAGGDVYKNDGATPTKVGVSTMAMASGGWSLGLTVYSEIVSNVQICLAIRESCLACCLAMCVGMIWNRILDCS